MNGEDHLFHGLTQEVLALAFKVQNRLGPGLLESAYEACLVHELRQAGFTVASQVPIDIKYDDTLVLHNAYRMDMVVNETLVLELKALEKLLPAHEAQLFTYLRFSLLPVGLLLNFWAWPLKEGGIKRVILPEK
ncbi:MAG TPA: GxxExxY protein [Holophagaceae bacterium]|nr:GxxExxY protein [Holophagaceae bacterium]